MWNVREREVSRITSRFLTWSYHSLTHTGKTRKVPSLVGKNMSFTLDKFKVPLRYTRDDVKGVVGLGQGQQTMAHRSNLAHISTKFLVLFVEIERERKGEREKYQCETSTGSLPYVPRAPSRDQTHNLGMCPDQELNLWPFGIWDDASATEPHWPELQKVLLEYSHVDSLIYCLGMFVWYSSRVE